uniref:DUF1771 domain-containing protein n=1 Tax=Angiostrongylus cantonensis TaxID=6313 RepID=A0A0K0D5T8_ANGCA
MLNPEADSAEHCRRSPATTSDTVVPAQKPSFKRQFEVNLRDAQEQARQYEKQANEFAEKKSAEIRKAERYLQDRNFLAADYFRQVAREHSLREMNLRRQAGDIIIKANENSAVLDFHHLSPKDAIMVLKERLSALDRELL